MQLVDTHCHLDILGSIETAIQNAVNNGVTKIINPATNSDSSREIIEIAAQFPTVFPAVGIHPVDTNTEQTWAEYPQDQVQAIGDLLQGHRCGLNAEDTQKIVAIGECGLDFKYAQTENQQNIQLRLFKQHVDWAEKYHLPLIIHNRKADDQLLATLSGKQVVGVFHCFAGSKKLVAKILELKEFYFGIGGLVTFDMGLQEVVKLIPLERIILETDAPYLTPKPIKDTKPWPNEPANTIHTARKLAELKNTTLSDLALITTKNAEKLFKIS